MLKLDDYAIGAQIATGGMGNIVEAEDRRLGRKVAVKVMRLDATTNEEARSRFVREASVLARLEHPNVIPIHELGWDAQGRPFYTMKLVHGRTLQAVIDGLKASDADFVGHYTLDRLLTIFRKICDALALAHARGVIHRDLKPQNVMVGEFGEVLVMDWGLAKILGDAQQSAEESRRMPMPEALLGQSVAHLSLNLALTMDGAVMGTPHYMSPEQAAGRLSEIDQQSDVFSLGAILYAMLALRPPVEASSVEEVLLRIRTGDIRPPTTFNPGSSRDGRAASLHKSAVIPGEYQPLPHCPGGRVPAALSSVAMQALAVDKKKRYASVMALATDVEAYQTGFATSAEHAGLFTQLRLLVQRHKREFAIGFAAWFIITALAVWFVLNLRASERETRRQAQIAIANEHRALAQEEQTRRTLAKTQVAVAEAAFRGSDRGAMVQALDAVPDDLRDQRWDYLSAKRDASLGELKVPGLPVGAAVAAVPGKPTQFAVADDKGNLAIVDVRTGEKRLEVKTGFANPILAFSENGVHLAVAAKGSRLVSIYDASDGRLLYPILTLGKPIARTMLSLDGNHLLLASLQPISSGNTLSLIDVRDGLTRWTMDWQVQSAEFSLDGKRLYLAVRQLLRTFRIIEVESGKTLVERSAYLFSIALSVDGKQLALGYHNGEVAIVDASTGAELRRARLHQGEVQRMAWTAGGHLLTMGSEGGSEGAASMGRRVLRMWETSAFAPRGTFFGLRQGGAAPVWEFHPASGCLLTDDAPPQLWRIPADADAGRIVCGSEQGWSVCFLSDTMLLGRKNYGLAPYDLSKPRSPRELPGQFPNSDIMCAVNWRAGLMATGRRINDYDSIRVYSIQGGVNDLKWKMRVPWWTLRLDFDAPGQRLLSLQARNVMLQHFTDCSTRIFDARDGKELLNLPVQMQRAVFAGSAGNFVGIVSKPLAGGESEDQVSIYDSTSGKVLKSVSYRLRLNEMVVSHDRKWIAIGGEEQVVRVLDADTLQERCAFRAHDEAISAMAFHPAAPILATAANDGSVKLWDYEKSRLRQSFLGIDGPPVMLAFNPTGRLLALESQEHVVRVFDLQDE